MAFKNPFVNPESLFFNEEGERKAIDRTYAAGDMARNLLVASPIAMGGYVGLKNLRSNEGTGLFALRSNAYKDSAVAVGANLKQQEKVRQQVRDDVAERYRKALLEGSYIDDQLRKGVAERQSLLSGIIESLDDPSMSGIDDISKQDIKRQLTTLMQREEIGMMEDSDQIVRRAVNTLTEGSDDIIGETLRRYERESARVKDFLTPPKAIPSMNRMVNPVAGMETVAPWQLGDDSLNPSAKSRLRGWQKLFGEGNVMVTSMPEAAAGGQKSFYATITTGGRKRHVGLQFARTKGTNVPVARFGGLGTAYTMDRYHIDAGMAEGALNRYKPGTPMDQFLFNQKVGGQAAMFGPEEMLLRKAQEMSSGVGGRLNWRDFNELSRMHTNRLPRAMDVAGGSQDLQAFQAISRRNLGIQHAYASIHNYQNVTDPTTFRSILATTEIRGGMSTGVRGGAFFDVGPAMPEISRIKEYLGGGSYTRVGINSGSVLSGLYAYGGESGKGFMNRMLAPLTARVEQLADRGSIMFSSNGAMNGVNSTLRQNSVAGLTVKQFGNNVQYAQETLGGGINRFSVMDWSGTNKFGLGDGEIRAGGRFRVTEGISKSIVNPFIEGNTKSGNKLLDALWSAHQEGRTLKWGSHKELGVSAGEMTKFFKEYGGYIGRNSTDMQFIPKYTGMSGLELGIGQIYTDDMGQSRIRIGGIFESSYDDGMKLFGPTGKGMTKATTQGEFSQLTGAAFKHLGFNAGNTLLVDSGMGKKSAYTLASGMVTGGASIVKAGRFNTQQEFMDEVSRRMSNMGTGDAMKLAEYGGRSGSQQREYLRNTASAVMSVLSEEASAGRILGSSAAEQQKQIGHVFAGFHAVASANQQSGGRKNLYGLGGKDADWILNKVPGSRAFGQGATSGLANMGAATFTAGPQASMYRATKGSITPRMYQFLQYNLTNSLGFTPNEATDFMTTFLSRKENIGKQINTLKDMMEMQLSITNNKMTLSGEVTPVSKLMQARAGALARERVGTEGISELLKSSDMHRISFKENEVLRQAAISEFGSDEIMLPGRRAMDGMRGTEINTIHGKMKIEGELTRRVDRFVEDIGKISTAHQRGDLEIEEAKRAFRGFKARLTELTSVSQKSILSGKLSGSSWSTARAINPEGELYKGMTGQHHQAMQRAVKRAGGQAQFMDAQAFFDTFKGFLADIPEGEKGAAKKELTQKMERFFWGMEVKELGGVGSPQGEMMMTSRYPQLGRGHTAFVETFRAPWETGAGDDILGRYRATAAGSEAFDTLVRSAPELQSGGQYTFGSLKTSLLGGDGGFRSSQGKAAWRSFLGSMMNNSGEFMGEGRGQTYFPGRKFEFSVHYGDKIGTTGSGTNRSLTLSNLTQMGGDNDGDMVQTTSLRNSQIAKIRSGDRLAKNAALNTRIQVERGILMEEISAGIESYGRSVNSQGASIADSIMQQSLKEQFAKAAGPMDVSVDRIRYGILASDMADDSAHTLLALLDPFQEGGLLKGKKLNTAVPIGDVAKRAISQAAGGDERAFWSLIDNIVLKDSPLLKEGGMTIRPADGSASFNIDIHGLRQSGKLQQALTISSELGIDKTRTLRQMETVLSQNTPGSQQSFVTSVLNRNDLRSAIALGQIPDSIEGSLTTASQKVSAAAGRFDKKLLGPVALGIAGALAMGSMVGDEGYSANPMLAPGEVNSPRVQQAIRMGEIFDREPTETPVSSLNSSRSNFTNRPFFDNTTYTSRQNSYQMSGRIHSIAGASAISDYFGGIGGSASFRINDTRRPITPNYTDRLNGME